MSSIKTEYRGKLAYVGMGRVGTIVNYHYEEALNDVNEYWVYRPLRSKKEFITRERPVILQKVSYGMVDEILNVTLKIKGQFYPGWSIKHPNDEEDDLAFGKRLAVARAMGDTEAINALLDKDFVDTYDEEYHPDGDNATTSTEEPDNNEATKAVENPIETADPATTATAA